MKQWFRKVAASAFAVFAICLMAEAEGTKVWPITVIPGGAEKVYDGEALEPNSAETVIIGEKMALSDHVDTDSIQFTESQTDVGTNALSRIVSGTVKILDKDGKDVSSYYQISYGYTNLVVKPREIILTTPTATYAYNGSVQSNETVIALAADDSVWNFPANDGAIATNFLGSITKPGLTTNAVSLTFADATKANNYIIENRFGTLTITKAPAPTIKIEDPTAIYNGKTNELVVLTGLSGTGLQGSDSLWAQVSVTNATANAGTYSDWSVQDWKIVGDGDVTDCYEPTNVAVTTGSLTIGKRAITLASRNAVREYNGKKLSKANDPGVFEVDEELGSFVGEEGATYQFPMSGVLEDVGTTNNVFIYNLKQGTLPSNYDISCVTGTLTIVKRGEPDFTVTTASGTYVYGGTNVVNNGFEVAGTVGDDELQADASYEYWEAGTYENVLTLTATNRTRAKDVSGNYDLTGSSITSGTITITKRPIEVTFEDRECTYTGEVKKPMVRINGTANNENAYIVCTNVTPIDVGQYNCTNLTVVISNSVVDTTANYDITYRNNEAMVVIQKANATVTSASAEKFYDGTPLATNKVDSTILPGDATVTTNGCSQTEPGQSYNTITINWYGDKDKNYNITTNLGTLTVKAARVAYDLGGGDWSEKPAQSNFWNKLGTNVTAKAPAREGYTFLGWTNAVTGSPLLDADTKYTKLTNEKDYALTAVWEKSDDLVGEPEVVPAAQWNDKITDVRTLPLDEIELKPLGLRDATVSKFTSTNNAFAAVRVAIQAPSYINDEGRAAAVKFNVDGLTVTNNQPIVTHDGLIYVTEIKHHSPTAGDPNDYWSLTWTAFVNRSKLSEALRNGEEFAATKLFVDWNGDLSFDTVYTVKFDPLTVNLINYPTEIALKWEKGYTGSKSEVDPVDWANATSTTTVLDNESFELVDHLTRTGYTFLGWTDGVNTITNTKGLVAQTLNATLTLPEITLTALWETNYYRFALDPRGGSADIDAFTNKLYCVEDCPITLPTTTAPTHYENSAWWSGDFDGPMTTLAIADLCKKPAPYTYSFSMDYDATSYSISFNNPTGWDNIDTEPYMSSWNENSTSYTVEDGTVSLIPASCFGCKFVTWEDESSAPVSDFSASAGGDRSFTVVWEEVQAMVVEYDTATTNFFTSVEDAIAAVTNSNTTIAFLDAKGDGIQGACPIVIPDNLKGIEINFCSLDYTNVTFDAALLTIGTNAEVTVKNFAGYIGSAATKVSHLVQVQADLSGGAAIKVGENSTFTLDDKKIVIDVAASPAIIPLAEKHLAEATVGMSDVTNWGFAWLDASGKQNKYNGFVRGGGYSNMWAYVHGDIGNCTSVDNVIWTNRDDITWRDSQAQYKWLNRVPMYNGVNVTNYEDFVAIGLTNGYSAAAKNLDDARNALTDPTYLSEIAAIYAASNATLVLEAGFIGAKAFGEANKCASIVWEDHVDYLGSEDLFFATQPRQDSNAEMGGLSQIAAGHIWTLNTNAATKAEFPYTVTTLGTLPRVRASVLPISWTGIATTTNVNVTGSMFLDSGNIKVQDMFVRLNASEQRAMPGNYVFENVIATNVSVVCNGAQGGSPTWIWHDDNPDGSTVVKLGFQPDYYMLTNAINYLVTVLENGGTTNYTFWVDWDGAAGGAANRYDYNIEVDARYTSIYKHHSTEKVFPRQATITYDARNGGDEDLIETNDFTKAYTVLDTIPSGLMLEPAVGTVVTNAAGKAYRFMGWSTNDVLVTTLTHTIGAGDDVEDITLVGMFEPLKWLATDKAGNVKYCFTPEEAFAALTEGGTVSYDGSGVTLGLSKPITFANGDQDIVFDFDGTFTNNTDFAGDYLIVIDNANVMIANATLTSTVGGLFVTDGADVRIAGGVSIDAKERPLAAATNATVTLYGRLEADKNQTQITAFDGATVRLYSQYARVGSNGDEPTIALYNAKLVVDSADLDNAVIQNDNGNAIFSTVGTDGASDFGEIDLLHGYVFSTGANIVFEAGKLTATNVTKGVDAVKLVSSDSTIIIDNCLHVLKPEDINLCNGMFQTINAGQDGRGALLSRNSNEDEKENILTNFVDCAMTVDENGEYVKGALFSTGVRSAYCADGYMPCESDSTVQSEGNFWHYVLTIEYKISYDLDGGAWKSGEVFPTSYNVESDDIVLPTDEDIVKKNWYLNGWTNDQGVATNMIPKGTTGDLKFFAVWADKVAKIEIDNMGVDGYPRYPIDPETGLFIGRYAEAEVTPSQPVVFQAPAAKTGFEFICYKDANNGRQYETNVTYTILDFALDADNKAHLCGVWAGDTVIIDDEGNRYNTLADALACVASGTLKVVGSGTEFTELSGATIVIDKDITLDLNGKTMKLLEDGFEGDTLVLITNAPNAKVINGTLGGLADTVKSIKVIADDEPVQAIDSSWNIQTVVPVAEDYIADGYKCVDVGENLYKIVPALSQLSFNAGIEGSVREDLVPELNNEPATFTCEGDLIALNDATRAGYTFTGWVDENGDTVTAFNPKGVTTDVTLTATWEATEYGITYELNGGAFLETAKDTFTAEDEAFDLLAPVRTGYDFSGWRLNGADPVSPCTVDPRAMTTAADFRGQVAVAEWKAACYVITFDTLGGEAVSELKYTQEMVNQGLVEIPVAEKVGCKFLYWKDAQGQVVNPGTVATGYSADLTAVYEHSLWTGDASVVDGNPEDGRGAAFSGAAQVTYSGYLMKDGCVMGKVAVTAGKASTAGKSTITMTVSQEMGSNKSYTLKNTAVTVTGDVLENITLTGAAPLTATISKISDNGLEGTFGDYTVIASADRFSTNVTKIPAATLAYLQGNWTATFVAKQGGNVTLKLAVAAKGKVTVTGNLPDGTAISTTAQLIYGDGVCLCPVVINAYTGKKGGMSFLVWFGTTGVGDHVKDDVQVSNLSGLVKDMDTLVTDFEFGLVSRVVETTPAGAYKFAVNLAAFALPAGYELVDCPSEVTVTFDANAKAVVAKAKTAKIDATTGDVTFTSTTESDNEIGLALTYTKATGALTGSFKLYAKKLGSTNKWSLKTYTVNVYGVSDELGLTGTAKETTLGNTIFTITADED